MESRRAMILSWLEQDKLAHDQLQPVLNLIGVLPGKVRWRHFLDLLMLWLGGLALAFSLMFFIAYNWSELGRFGKFALVESSIVIVMAIYWFKASKPIVAKVLLLVASILVGVLLALFGQTYQTGADPWQLFATWSLMILPWVFISQFAAMWILWLALVNLAMALYYHALGHFFWFSYGHEEQLLWMLMLLNLIALVVWEFAARRFTWLAERWAIRLPALVSGVVLTMLMLEGIFSPSYVSWVIYPVYPLSMAALFYMYRHRVADLFMLAGGCTSLIVTISSFMAEGLFKHADALGFLLLSIMVIGMAAWAGNWLKQVYREFQS